MLETPVRCRSTGAFAFGDFEPLHELILDENTTPLTRFEGEIARPGEHFAAKEENGALKAKVETLQRTVKEQGKVIKEQGKVIKELTETVNKSESFAKFGSWIEAARDLVCAYLHNNDVNDNHTAKAQGQQEIIPFPQTWSELVAEDNYERSVARRERRHPQSLKPAFLSAVPGVLGLSQEQWGLIEQFYSDRCDCFHRKKTPTETAKKMLNHLPADYTNLKPLLEIIIDLF